MRRNAASQRSRLRANTVPSERPLLSSSLPKQPTRHSDDGSVDASQRNATTRDVIGYCDNSGVKLANQEEEEQLVDVVDRLQVAKSRAKADRTRETMRLRKDYWMLEAQKKAMTKASSTMAFNDLLRATRFKRDHTNDGPASPTHTPSLSPRLHTRLTAWQRPDDEHTKRDALEMHVKTVQQSSRQNTPSRFNTLAVSPTCRRSARSPRDVRKSPFVSNGEYTSAASQRTQTNTCSTQGDDLDNQTTIVDLVDVSTSSSTVNSKLAGNRARSISLPSFPGALDRNVKSELQTVADQDSVYKPKQDVHEGRTKNPDEIRSFPNAISPASHQTNARTRQSGMTRAHSRSDSYLSLAQNSVTSTGKIRAVNDKTICLHGRTTRALRRLTNVDSVAAAETEQRRREIRQRRKELKEKEIMKLQEKVDGFLKRMDTMESNGRRHSSLPHLASTF